MKKGKKRRIIMPTTYIYVADRACARRIRGTEVAKKSSFGATTILISTKIAHIGHNISTGPIREI